MWSRGIKIMQNLLLSLRLVSLHRNEGLETFPWVISFKHISHNATSYIKLSCTFCFQWQWLQALHLVYQGHACFGPSLPQHLSPLLFHFLFLTPLQTHWCFSPRKYQAHSDLGPCHLLFTLSGTLFCQNSSPGRPPTHHYNLSANTNSSAWPR